MTTDLGPRLTAKQVAARYIHSLQDGSMEALPALPSNDVITGRGAFPRSACIAWLVFRARNKSKNK